ncbi:MAG: M24 family metallopeptidase [bacterium]|nr:M24 family metallopeptidase [bacterium]
MNLFAHREEEFQIKLDRLRGVMQAHSADNLLITEAHHFSWLTGGGENFVFTAQSGGAAPLLVTHDRVYLAANTIEATRLFPEELEDLPIEDARHAWPLPPDEVNKHYQRLSPGVLVKDTDLETEIRNLHTPFTPDEIERYRWLGRMAEESIRTACKAARKGMTEYQVAALLAKECFDREIWPVLILAASDDRLMNYRHPLPTEKPIENEFMLVLCARRYGLIANVSRIVCFNGVSDTLRAKHQAVCAIDAALILGSTPGAAYGGVLREAIRLYQECGFEHEWELHHQGGPTGYIGRYFKATPTTREIVKDRSAVAWNPSISGTKSEDTVLITENGPEVLTAAREWPMIEADYRGRTIQRCDLYTP